MIYHQIVRIRLVVCIILLIAITPFNAAIAQDVNPDALQFVVPIYDKFIVTKVPGNWQRQAAFEKNEKKSYIVEFLPKNQTLENWSQMVTLMGIKEFSGLPKDIFTNIYQRQEKICAGNVAAKIYAENEGLFVALLLCGGIGNSASGTAGLGQGQSEMAIYKITKSAQSIQMVFKSWRGKSFDVNKIRQGDLPAEDMANYLTTLRQTMICDRANPNEICEPFLKFIPQ